MLLIILPSAAGGLCLWLIHFKINVICVCGIFISVAVALVGEVDEWQHLEALNGNQMLPPLQFLAMKKYF
jgi:hypothetical protein